MERNFFDCDDSVNPAFMRRAIELAKRGEGRTNPNPLVGAVIVKEGRIIGEGYHHSYGNLHAEREALKDCMERGENPENAVIYVTLEPCCHVGKQPPCTHAIRDAKISCVVVGSRDPNPLVHGKGNAFLREQGVKVIEDFLKSECDSLNPIFFYYITHSLPYVAVKFAMTLDGKIATKTGLSKWITNEESRKYVHVLRNKYYGIMAGIGTVLKDNPMLTCRLENDSGELVGRNPVRVICDSNLRIPVESNIVKSAGEVRTIVAFADSERNLEIENSLEQKKQILEERGV
ncbi:MAG: bifunctional diaminohydroxyphosphoribosylaminopyrimidine deaminase/5-amino-6-(5-phosphoribosylamino)uracil reductase RibD, partial [Treponema sp.]|nr:bifunctional diaminohydroxyphosphoribosylaminopyrimidine deaminase/5-amino-6-(5-phosphoribosylamino)uracil reductase RibD [Treponema sp.]